MSIDFLQDRIRQLKNPSVVDFNLLPEHIPPHIEERDTFFVSAYEYFSTELLLGLKDVVPAVRFSFPMMSLYGPDGMVALEKLLRTAKELGYYVFLDCPDAKSPVDSQRIANLLLGETESYQFDGLIVNTYIGSDAIRPLCDLLKKKEKDVFVLVRTPNKSASELQDLLTGSRHVHLATADMINRFSEVLLGRRGYSQIGAVMAANGPESIKLLRSKYKSTFILMDGYDYPNANAKNCSFAFDRLGYGAVACASTSITAAWQTNPVDHRKFVDMAVESAQRMKKNLTRYITIL